MKTIRVGVLLLACTLIMGVQAAQAGRCNPNGICTACSNCSACKHCSQNGGSCSVCAGSRSSSSSSSYDDSSNSGSYSSRYQTSNQRFEPAPYDQPTPVPIPREEVNRLVGSRGVPSVRVVHQLADSPPPRDALESLLNQFAGKCTGVNDGDTISVMHNGRAVKVRFYGVNAPETGQPFSTQAKKLVSEAAFGKNVTIYSKGKDRYGRILGWVFVGEQCLNRSLVNDGLARWYRQYAPNEKKLALLETQAKEAGRGLWSDCCAIAPWEWRRGKRPEPKEQQKQSAPAPQDAVQSKPDVASFGLSVVALPIGAAVLLSFLGLARRRSRLVS